jgi:hypothetical protein
MSTPCTPIHLRILASSLLVMAGTVCSVDAQTPDRKWELEDERSAPRESQNDWNRHAVCDVRRERGLDYRQSAQRGLVGNSTAPVTSLGVTGLAPSTVSGPAITGHRTWSGSGVARHTNIAAGVFWRF